MLDSECEHACCSEAAWATAMVDQWLIDLPSGIPLTTLEREHGEQLRHILRVALEVFGQRR